MVTELLVIGKHGQLARALQDCRPDATFLDRSMMDLSRPETIPDILRHYQPRAVINAAAYTMVDNAEKEETLVYLINAESPRVMAQYCAEHSIPFVHFSTDYVFDGSENTPRKETDATNPLNVYGRSKLASENAVRAIGGRYLIFRTSWVYDAAGKNFLNSIIRIAKEREELRIIAEQFGAPTYAPHLAAATLSALENAAKHSVFPSGIYHMCNGGTINWHGFAQNIVDLARRYAPDEIQAKMVTPIPASEYPLPAKRPANSRLDCNKLKETFNITLPDWHQGLEECMRKHYEHC